MMCLEDIPEVCIEHSGNYKFVQVQGPEGRNYIHGKSKWESHKGVFELDFIKVLKAHEVEPIGFRCVGGGEITINKSKKVLTASDSSEKYGNFDREVVRSLLERYVTQNLEGYSVQIK